MPDPRVYPVDNVNDGATPVQTASTEVLAANPARADLELVNDSNKTIYVARGNDAVLHQGITLLPGGSYSMRADNLFLGAINAIAEGGDKVLTYSEGEWQQ